MFTRTSEPKTRFSDSVQQQSDTPALTRPENGEKSVIGNDLKILGKGLKIIGRGVLQIDGELESDVQATEVVVGQQGKVTGMVSGEQVTVHGEVLGMICAKRVTLQASSKVEGDVHHLALVVQQGALFEGRSCRASSETELNAAMDLNGAG